jgi:hypothetical protein
MSVRKKLGEQASCLFGECTGRMPGAPSVGGGIST